MNIREARAVLAVLEDHRDGVHSEMIAARAKATAAKRLHTVACDGRSHHIATVHDYAPPDAGQCADCDRHQETLDIRAKANKDALEAYERAVTRYDHANEAIDVILGITVA